MNTRLGITAQVVFTSGLIIEDGQICLDAFDNPNDLREQIRPLVEGLRAAHSDYSDRVVDDFARLLQCTTDYASPKFNPSMNAEEEIKCYVRQLNTEVCNFKPFTASNVKQVTLWLTNIRDPMDGAMSITIRKDDAVSPFWLQNKLDEIDFRKLGLA